VATIKCLASQAKSVNLYKSLGTKVMKWCTNIYFNRQSLIKIVTRKYAKIKDSLYISCCKHHPKGSTDNPAKMLN